MQVGDSAGSRVHSLAREKRTNEGGKELAGAYISHGVSRACSQTPYLRIDTQFPASLAPIGGIVAPDRGGPPFDFK